MAITTPTTRPAIWAETGDTTAPSTGEQQSGYIVGKPSRQKTNWLLNWIDNAVQYLLSYGIPEWSVPETYPPNARVQHSGTSWQNVSGGNLTTTEPGTDVTKWSPWGHCEKDVVGNVAASITVEGNWTMTKAQAFVYGSCTQLLLLFTGNYTSSVGVELSFADNIAWARGGTSGFPYFVYQDTGGYHVGSVVISPGGGEGNVVITRPPITDGAIWTLTLLLTN